MRPLLLAAASSLALWALGSLDGRLGLRGPREGRATPTRLEAVRCREGHLPEGELCIPLPLARGEGAAPGASNAGLSGGVAQGRTEDGERVARAPDRPRELQLYRLPFEPTEVLWSAGEGWGARGSELVRLVGEPGSLVPLIALEGQEGEASVVFTGELLGLTVITSHLVRASGRLQQLLLVHAELEGLAPNLLAGTVLAEGEPLGTAKAEGLLLGVRLVHDGIGLEQIAPRRLLEPDVSAPTDPRNALQLGL